MQFKRTIVFGALLGLLIFGTAGCSLTKKQSTPTETDQQTTDNTDTTQTAAQNLTNIDPSAVSEKTLANSRLSREKAAQWQSDAALYYVSLKLDPTLSPDGTTETYTYGSANSPNAWWTISLSQSTGKFIRAIIPKEDYLGTNINPINTAFWKINYVQAFQTAELSGGKDFRTANPDAQISLDLFQGQPKGWLWWIVKYESAGASPLNILVNANTGEAADENGQPMSSTTQGPTGSSTQETTQ